MNTAYLTFSIDDGHPTDFKSAELLAHHGFKATFYIPAQNPERQVMTGAEVQRLSQDFNGLFEIGGHTYNHKPLKNLSADEAFEEISRGKKWMEDLLGKATPSFCYPQGKFKQETKTLVQKAGYRLGRTCQFNLVAPPTDPFEWGVSTHAYSHRLDVQVRHALLERNFTGLFNFARVHHFKKDWASHFLRAVDYVETHGGIAHLFFHSWEIEEQEAWPRLKTLLAELASRKSLVKATNGELFT